MHSNNYRLLTEQDRDNLLKERVLKLEAMHWEACLMLAELEGQGESVLEETVSLANRRNNLNHRLSVLIALLDKDTPDNNET